jgi:F-type H+-transporting ATPase subunit gamma
MAEQISRIKARLKSLDQLSDLVGAMRAMSASNLQQAQTAMKAVRGYRAIVTDAIAAATAGDDHEDHNGNGVSPLVLAIATEHGFVGNFNTRILDAVSSSAPGARVVLVGSRGGGVAEEMTLDVERLKPKATHVKAIGGLALRLARQLRGEPAVTVVYARYEASGRFEIVTEPILPMRPERLARREGETEPLLQLPRPALMRTLASEYLVAALADALTESLASESAARLQTMDAAHHNLDDKLEGLQREFNMRRQEEITTELGDLIAGSEAAIRG